MICRFEGLYSRVAVEVWRVPVAVLDVSNDRAAFFDSLTLEMKAPQSFESLGNTSVSTAPQ